MTVSAAPESTAIEIRCLVAVWRGVDGIIVIQDLQLGGLLCLLERQSLSFAPLSDQLRLFDKPRGQRKPPN